MCDKRRLSIKINLGISLRKYRLFLLRFGHFHSAKRHRLRLAVTLKGDFGILTREFSLENARGR